MPNPLADPSRPRLPMSFSPLPGRHASDLAMLPLAADPISASPPSNSPSQRCPLDLARRLPGSDPRSPPPAEPAGNLLPLAGRARIDANFTPA